MSDVLYLSSNLHELICCHMGAVKLHNMPADSHVLLHIVELKWGFFFNSTVMFLIKISKTVSVEHFQFTPSWWIK